MVILLNGTSSSGKTSTAKTLLNKLSDPYFYFSVDQFLEPSMPSRINMDKLEDLAMIDKAISGFNQSFRSYKNAIDFMIIDLVLHKTTWLKEIAESLHGTHVFFVNVSAPLDVIEKRESERLYRQPGTARAQYQFISSYPHDCTIDTSAMTSDEAAEFYHKTFKSRIRSSASSKDCLLV